MILDLTILLRCQLLGEGVVWHLFRARPVRPLPARSGDGRLGCALWRNLTVARRLLLSMMVALLAVMNALRFRDLRVRGVAVGVAAHGIGTARAFQVDPLAGTFAGIAMG